METKVKVGQKGNIDDIYPLDEVIKKIRLVPTSSLRQHEVTKPAKVSRLVKKIKNDGIFTSPIIGSVLKDFTLVVDGNHRAEAVGKNGLDLPLTMVYDVDYITDKRLTLGPWIRSLWGFLAKSFAKHITSKHIYPELVFVGDAQDLDLDDLHDLTVFYETKAYQPSPPLYQTTTDILEKYNYCNSIEKEFSIEKFDTKKAYLSVDEAKARMTQKQRLTIFPPHITKKEVIDVAREGKVFPIHSTRHELPLRVFGCVIALDKLASGDDPRELEEALHQGLYSMNKDDIGYYPSGLILDRYFSEPTIIFNEKKMLPILKEKR